MKEEMLSQKMPFGVLWNDWCLSRSIV